jgi:membrane-associated protein
MDPRDWLTGSAWSYLIVAGSIAGSAVLPPLPSELTLVTAMSMAVEGELRVLLVALACGAGAVRGDAFAYTVGRLARRGADEGRGPQRTRKALAWIEGRDRIWLAGLIVTGRFVPGGTTAIGVAAGATSFPIPRFVVLALAGAALWTGYGYGLARVVASCSRTARC